MLLYLIWDLHPILLALSGDRFFTGIGHAAHLGGLAFGFLYGHFQWRVSPLVDWFPWPGRGPGAGQLRVVRFPDAGRQSNPDADADRLDRLLEKISGSGQASLSD